jgi:hypothetical protein
MPYNHGTAGLANCCDGTGFTGEYSEMVMRDDDIISNCN